MKALIPLLLLLSLASHVLASRNDPHVTVIGLLGQKALLRIDVKRAEAAFPQVFAPDAPDALGDDWDEEGE